MASACLRNCTASTMAAAATASAAVAAAAGPGQTFFDPAWTSDELWRSWEALGFYFGYQPWFFALIGSAMVGLSGIFPLLVIPIDEAAALKTGDSSKTLKILLSFAVGGLLGDVFLHILPEAWANHIAVNEGKTDHATMGCGLWVLAGFFVFVMVEMIFGSPDEQQNVPASSKSIGAATSKLPESDNNNYERVLKNGLVTAGGPNNLKSNGLRINGLKQDNLAKPKDGCKNGYTNGFVKPNGLKSISNGFSAPDSKSSLHDLCEQRLNKDEVIVQERPKHIAGYLNLMANCVDNFTHGLAVGGSFMISFRLGAFTTFAILIHEIPHEIGDFAILLKSGFTRWDAAKAQILTASGGILGAFFAVVFSGNDVESKTSWILPFTAGSFLHIGLVTVLPELLRETNTWESFKQISALITGITVMAFLTFVCD